MGAQLRSALLAGFAAGFIWMFISNMVGGQDAKTIAWVGLIFVVAVAVITAAIAAVVARGKTSTTSR